LPDVSHRVVIVGLDNFVCPRRDYLTDLIHLIAPWQEVADLPADRDGPISVDDMAGNTCSRATGEVHVMFAEDPT
jgi:hypothetical protein